MDALMPFMSSENDIQMYTQVLETDAQTTSTRTGDNADCGTQALT